MSRCSSTNTGIVILETKTRQIFFTRIVSMCSLTIGLCLEWTWCTVNAEKDNPIAHSKHTYQTQALNDLLYFGIIVSAGPAAFVSSLLGLKSALVIGLVITTCGSIVIIYSTGALLWLYIGRIMHGLGAGFVFVIVPNYASEIAEPKFRDMLASFHYVFLLTGMFLSHMASEIYIYIDVNKATLFMSIWNIIALSVINDPPYYRLKLEKRTNILNYVLKIQDYKRSNICRRVYTKLKDYRIDNSIRFSLIFKQKQFWQPLLLNAILIFIQQFSGLVSLTSKLECLYDILHICDRIPATTAILFLQLITSLICFYIVNSFGKRNLLMVSGFGMAITTTLMNISYDKEIVDRDELVLFGLIVIYIIFFSIGYGPIPWMLMPELCPRRSRLWTSGVIVSLYAFLKIINNPSFYENIKFVYGLDIIVLSFSIICLSGGIIALIFVPEKKNYNNML